LNQLELSFQFMKKRKLIGGNKNIKKEINRSQNFLIYNLEQLFYEIKIYKNETEDSNNHNITFSEFI
jgi:hypothetical protein